MKRILVCYKDLSNGKVYVDAKKDFNEIKMYHGEHNYIVLDSLFCVSKKQEIKYTNDCLKKFK